MLNIKLCALWWSACNGPVTGFVLSGGIGVRPEPTTFLIFTWLCYSWQNSWVVKCGLQRVQNETFTSRSAKPLCLSDDVGRLARPSSAYLGVAPALFRFCCRLDGIIGLKQKSWKLSRPSTFCWKSEETRKHAPFLIWFQKDAFVRSFLTRVENCWILVLLHNWF